MDSKKPYADLEDFFYDTGYKYFSMPPDLAVDDYIDLIKNGDRREFEGKELDEWTDKDIKDRLNECIRLKILSFLKSVEVWTQEHYKLLEYIISDLDFYSSEERFVEVYNQFLRCK